MELYADIGGGERIHYLESGKGEALIVIPSLGCSSRSYRGLGEALSKYYRVYVVDIYKGKSIFHENTTSLKDYVTQLHRFVTSLKLKKFYLVGASASGYIAVQYALCHPATVKKIALVTSYIVPLNLTHQAWWLWTSYCRLYFHNLFSAVGIKSDLLWTVDGLENFFRHPGQMINEYRMAMSYTIKAPRRVPVPTIFYFAKHDEFIPYRLLAEIRKIGNLQVEVVDEHHTWFFFREGALATKISSFFVE